LGFRVWDLWSGVKVLKFQGFRVSRCQGISASGFQDVSAVGVAVHLFIDRRGRHRLVAEDSLGGGGGTAHAGSVLEWMDGMGAAGEHGGRRRG